MSGMLTRASLRAFSTSNLKVVNDVAKQQFKISMHGDEAVLGYEKQGNTIKFTNTNVPPPFQGKGAGKLLAEYAFKYAHDNQLEVICQCHFLCEYYKKNSSKYQKLKVKVET